MPRPKSLPGRRLTPVQRGLAAGYALLLAALVPAFALVAPPSRWDDPVTLLALVALGVVAGRSEAALPARVAVGSLSGLSLVAVALAGPLPALVVLGCALAAPAVLRRERLVRAGNLSNAASHGAYVLAGALTLAALGDGVGGLAAAMAVQLLVNWAVGPALFATLWLGMPLRAVVAVGARGMLAGAGVGTLALLAVLATPVAGILALGLFAFVVLVPQATLAFLARSGPVMRLDRTTATARYARALALEAGLERPDRERVDAVARLVATRRPTGTAIDHMVATLTDRSAAACDAGHLTEWWDGTGGPANLTAGMIPIAARIVAVADTWSALTAAGSEGLSHAAAMARLHAEAGERLDPAVVADAERIALGLSPVADPGLHAVAVPAVLRRRFAVPGASPSPAP